MKQKIVIKVFMNDHKCRSKALKISVGVVGVESAALTGSEKDQVEVVGEGVDAVELTRQLRKNVAYAELVSVVEHKKEQSNSTPPPPPVIWPYNGFPHYQICEATYDPPRICTIM
ncbi:hypothetical protein BUALT_Bualt03G0175800 [Buddleja alternifolia]|uniref:HMA domain-containing protein n=1 Tax=Buddleja alternifolia TaxID=168488 RepID=A0AAV6XUM4_9LAMI|nr:hypothetical protein BUALT_Bualt03G0175800 [Buddleja alternifolia]